MSLLLRVSKHVNRTTLFRPLASKSTTITCCQYHHQHHHQLHTTVTSYGDPEVIPGPFSPGGKAGKIAEVDDQAAGKEYEELQAAKDNEERFAEGPLVGPFGTIKEPAIVLSSLDHRIVGCIGGAGYAHRLLWFVLRQGKKHACKECGQIFQLQTADAEDVDRQTHTH